MWTFTVVFIIVLCFVFVDVWYFVRFVPLMLRVLAQYFSTFTRTVSREVFLSTSKMEGVVLPSDLDHLLHMNNSKYLREMDFGRFSHAIHTKLYASTSAVGATMLVGAIMIRYRRSLNLWQRFQLHTRILCWDDSSFYFEQQFVNKGGFVCAIAFTKMVMKRKTPTEVLERTCVGGYCQSPPFPPEVDAWTETIRRSSEALKSK